MKTLRYDGPSKNSLTTGGSGFASASLALTIMLAVSACSTPPYPRKLLSEIRAEEAANQLSLQTQLPAPQPQVLETAAGPIDPVPASALAAESETAPSEPAQGELANDMDSSPIAAPQDLDDPAVVSQELRGKESPAATAAAGATPAEDRMTIVADAVPPEVAADQPPARAWVDPDPAEEIREGETITAPTATTGTAPIEIGSPEVVSADSPSEAPSAEITAAETAPDKGQMTLVADAVPPEVIADQPPARAWVDPDSAEEIRKGETMTAPTATTGTAPIETGSPEVDTADSPSEAPSAEITAAETAPDKGQMTLVADAVPPEVIADQPPARAWLDPDLTSEIHEGATMAAPAGPLQTDAAETRSEVSDAAAHLEPAFDIATLDPEANVPFDAVPLPEGNPATTEAMTAETTQADTTDADMTAAEAAPADLPAPPEENLEVAVLVAAPTPSLVTEPTTLPLPEPKAPSLRREPKAAHKRRWSVPGEGGLIELEQPEAHRAPVRPSPSLTTTAVTSAADPQTDQSEVDTEAAAPIADSRTSRQKPSVLKTEVSDQVENSAEEQRKDQETVQELSSLPVAEVDRRTVVAVPSDAPQLASTTANLPRANEPRDPLTGLQVLFAPGSSDLSDEARSSLAGLAEQLDVASTPRLRLSAFSAAGDNANGQSRRLSLSRLFAVRNFLIEQGLRSEDIDLMPMAGAEDENPIDLVELEIDRT